MPGARGAHPGADALLRLGVGPMTDDDFAIEAHARVDEPRFAVAVRRLIEVHEIHVDGVPRQLAIELGVEMEERLLEQVEATNPHLRRREGMHPQDKAGAVRVGGRIGADFRDLIGRRGDELEHGLERKGGRRRELGGDLGGVACDLFERPGPVQMLRAADEPDLWRSEIDHFPTPHLWTAIAFTLPRRAQRI